MEDLKCKTCNGEGKMYLIFKPRAVGISVLKIDIPKEIICPDCLPRRVDEHC